MALRALVGRPDSGGDGLTTDAVSHYWITSHLGIQVFDANGRMGGIVSRPQKKTPSTAPFTGLERTDPRVGSCDKIVRRKILMTAPSLP